MENNSTIIVYTDGGCSGNPGPGGWGTVILVEKDEIHLSGGEDHTTNNRMELSAAIAALTKIYNEQQWQKRPVSIYIDSQYVKNGITTWIAGWKKNGWLTAAKKPVLNKDLWTKLDTLTTQMKVEWSWVKGHAGIHYNEICDQLCQKEIASRK